MINSSMLTAFIASRICHDLVSPIASISSALELLNDPDSADMHAQAEQLLQTGADSASTRIQFLRYAFGTTGLSDTDADPREVRNLVEGFASERKAGIEWVLACDRFGCHHAQILLNLTIMAVAAIPRGGMTKLWIGRRDSTLVLTARSSGTLVKLDELTRQTIDGIIPEEGWSAHNIQPLFTKMIVDNLGGNLGIVTEDDGVVFTVSGLRT